MIWTNDTPESPTITQHALPQLVAALFTQLDVPLNDMIEMATHPVDLFCGHRAEIEGEVLIEHVSNSVLIPRGRYALGVNKRLIGDYFSLDSRTYRVPSNNGYIAGNQLDHQAE